MVNIILLNHTFQFLVINHLLKPTLKQTFRFRIFSVWYFQYNLHFRISCTVNKGLRTNYTSDNHDKCFFLSNSCYTMLLHQKYMVHYCNMYISAWFDRSNMILWYLAYFMYLAYTFMMGPIEDPLTKDLHQIVKTQPQ